MLIYDTYSTLSSFWYIIHTISSQIYAINTGGVYVQNPKSGK